MKYGLLGLHLTHSYSQRIHKSLSEEDYQLIECKPKELDTILNDSNLQGCNITNPYKEKILQYCSSTSEIVEKIGCANTLVKTANGWQGHNTDYEGFIYSVTHAAIDINRRKCIILGDGATSRTIHAALETLGAAEIIHISRQSSPTYRDLNQFYNSAEVIINTTPVGTYPNCPENIINITQFTNLIAVIDVIYNPLRTNLIIQAERMGIPTLNGLSMLVAQAHLASNLFHNIPYDETLIQVQIKELLEEIENIILIGMPGVGKTTVGKKLSEMTKRKFIDCDEEITKEIGHIGTFIDTHGEKAFREVESEVIERIGKERGLVISTGGGCVTIASNFAPLRQNGRIYQLTQPLDSLDTKGRPLSRGGLSKLAELERIRTPLYQSFAQKIIHHNRHAEETAQKILNDFYKEISNQTIDKI